MNRSTKSLLAVVAVATVAVGMSACTPVEDGTTHAEKVVKKQAATKNAAKPAKSKQAGKPAETKKAPHYTASQENAIASATDYLDYTAFSRRGLIGQLSSKSGEGFPKADAVFAVNHVKVNWKDQAAKSAKGYLEVSSFSRSGLIGQLESKAGEGFTHAQAVYGVKKTGL